MPAVSYTLLVDDAPADPDLLAVVQQVEIEEHSHLADMLRLRLAVGVGEAGSDWTLLDDAIFTRLKKLKVTVGVGSNTSESLMEAYVIGSDITFSNEPGQSVLEVVAMDATVLMNLEEKIRPWPNMADSDIASTIFGEYGFTPQVESTQLTRQEVDQTVIQRCTDIQFLRELAQRYGYECFVELVSQSGTVIGHFHPPQLDATPQGVLSINLGEATNINNFEARFDMLQPVVADAAGLAIGSQADQSASISNVSQSELGSDSVVNGSQQRRVLLSHTGLAETGELQTYAQAVVDQSAWAIIAEGELNTVAYGNVLRAKRPVLVRGAGRQFSGTYYVEKVQHLITGEGYTQHFTLRRNATGLAGTESFQT